MTSRKQDRAQWYRVDLHLHTPASADYHQPTISYLEVLQRAELRGIDILAFTDHNTVSGYAAMRREIDQLEFLASRGRATPDESRLLVEYQRLLNRILVLPGFEFTATFGFHVLGIFPPDTPIRRLEHVLLSLHVPYEAIESGLTEVGASSDVLTAYRAIYEAGGICIAAHVNAAHGVAMWNLDFGGQTRIAYTQDRHLHALEVTDLSKRGRYATASFFDGSKPEYPRRMRSIQGSDAHRLDSQLDKRGKVINFGVGERATEMRLRERSFDALVELFESNDYSSSRPYTPGALPEDPLLAVRAEGANLTQVFHESATQGGVLRYNILADVCAFANTQGGTLYLGMGTDPLRLPIGIDDSQTLIAQLTRAVDLMLTPSLSLVIDAPQTNGRTIVRVQVPNGPERPYALEGSKIYVRSGVETTLASRDQIIAMVIDTRTERELPPVVASPLVEPPLAAMPTPPKPTVPVERSLGQQERRQRERPQRRDGRGLREDRPLSGAAAQPEREPIRASAKSEGVPEVSADELPRYGVEVVAVEPRGSLNIYTMRDLQTGGVVKNVTRMSASKMWRYAIKQQETNPVQLDKVRWNGIYGLWRKYRRLAEVRYDLVLRTKDGARYFYGVPDTQLKSGWLVFANAEAQADEVLGVTEPISESAPPVSSEGSSTVSDSAPVEAEVINAEDAPSVTPAKRKRRRRGGRRRKSAAVASAEGAAPVEAAHGDAPAMVATVDPAPVTETSSAPTSVDSQARKTRSPRGKGGKKAEMPAPADEIVARQAIRETPAPDKPTRKGKKSADTPAAERADAEVETAAPKKRSGRKKAPSE